MNEIVNKFLLAEDKFIREMYLRQLGFAYTVCGPFTKNKEYKNLKIQEIHYIFFKTNQIKLLFNMTQLNRDFKSLTRRTASDKKLLDKAFNIAKNSKHDRYLRGADSMVNK